MTIGRLVFHGWVRGVALSGVLCGTLLFSAAEASGQSVEPQPSVDLPADMARVLRDYERNWAAGNARALSELFVEEGLIVRGTWIRGRAAIEEAYQNASGPLRLRAVEHGSDGDVGYIVGAYGYGAREGTEDGGLFVLTLRRAPDGRWLIVSDMDRGIG